jgi:hypothetical protein
VAIATVGKRFYSTANHGRGLPWLEVNQVENAVWDAFASLATGRSSSSA